MVFSDGGIVVGNIEVIVGVGVVVKNVVDMFVNGEGFVSEKGFVGFKVFGFD